MTRWTVVRLTRWAFANYNGDCSNYPASASTTLTVQANSSTTGTIYKYSANSYDTNGNVLSFTDSVMGACNLRLRPVESTDNGGEHKYAYGEQLGAAILLGV